MNKLQPFGVHNHTHASNFRLRDAINKPEELLDYALELGLPGVAITDHETLSSHVKAHRYIESNRDRFGDFKLAFGNEIYLVDKDDTLTKKENNEKISFHHFILVAKDDYGYEGLRKLSSRAWSNSFFYKGMERVPTYKDELMALMEEYRGHIIATTACVGGEIPQLLIKYHNEPTEENKAAVHNTIVWLKGVFGDDLYFELQPSQNLDQMTANKMLWKVGYAYGIKCIISTDAHYLSKDQAQAHEIYLRASDGDREVAEFYSTTYVMDRNELLEYFGEEELDEMIENTHFLMNTIGEVKFEQQVKIPKARIPKFEKSTLLEPYHEQYEYIRRFSESSELVDKYYLYLISEGLRIKNQALNDENLSRINIELEEIYHISKDLGQSLSSYFVLATDVIDIMWSVSLVGTSRGSACCYYTNYLLDIVQLNPIEFSLPHWRFLTRSRPELPDIDIDSESSKRAEIIALTKEAYGEENVLNMGTFTTEGTKSTILTSCRGLGIDKDVAHNISSLVPTEKNSIWSIKDCFNGNQKKNRKPAIHFITEVEKYEGLKEAMLAIEGIVSGRGQHASGVIIFPNGYVAQNAMMKTTSGLPITQFDMNDSTFMGGLKLDYLSINALDRIRAALDLLVEYEKIEWQGTLRATYNKYFHPDVLEMNDPEMWNMLFDGHVLNAFQFETPIGQQTLMKLNARTFDELCAANSLMRLTTDGEQPLDKFIKFRDNISLWYTEMRSNGLSNEEIKVLEKHLLVTNGICDSQEGLMMLIMDEKISSYDLGLANKFRKAVAKQDQNELAKQKITFFEKGKVLGTSEAMLKYVWEYQFVPSFGYAFSKPHTVGYTLILMIEMNICFKYGPVFWKCACLSVNSGLVGESAGATNYGAIAKAIGDMKGDVLPPDINLSNMSFTPLESDQKILFGLKPIAGLGVDAIEAIITHRPYSNFDDFYEKIIETKLISESRGVTLIKAGCFDKLNPERRTLMIDYVRKIVPKREKLTMVQLPTILHLIDKEKYAKELKAYEFRNKIQGRKRTSMNKEIEQEFIKNYSSKVLYSFENGQLKIDDKSWNKFYLTEIERLREWVVSPVAAELFNKVKMQEYWSNNCQGTKESWEMETNLFYSDKHELDYIPLNNYFNCVNFNDLSSEPAISGYKTYRGRKIPQFQIDVIAGTVVDKTKGRNLISVLTKDGLVTVRYSKGSFLHYDKKVVRVVDGVKEVLDESWFQRGNLLVFVGFRRGDEFVLRTTGSRFTHSTMKILGYNQEKINLQMEKVSD